MFADRQSLLFAEPHYTWVFPQGISLGETLATDFATSCEVERLDLCNGDGRYDSVWRNCASLPAIMFAEFVASLPLIAPIGQYQYNSRWQADYPDWLAPLPVRCEICRCDLGEDSGEETREPESGDYAGDALCDDCYCEEYSSCCHCGDECGVNASDTYAPECGDGYYCERCYSDLFHECDDCGRVVDSDDSYSASNDRTVCERCYENYFCCEGCGETYDNDRYAEDGYCDRCAPDGQCCPFEGCGFDCDSAENTFNRIGPRKFGVELETSRVDERDASRLERCAFDCKHDSSIEGMELVSPPMCGDLALAAIDDFCDSASRSEVDSACGFHLHINAGDLTTEQRVSVAVAYLLTETVWQSFVPRDRRSNSYCHSIRWEVAEALDCETTGALASLGGTRYQWLNTESLTKHRTFEVRLHTATLDAPKVQNWARAHTAFVDWASKQTADELQATFTGSRAKQFDTLAAIWGAAGMADLRAFYCDRARQFGCDYAAELASELAPQTEPELIAA